MSTGAEAVVVGVPLVGVAVVAGGALLLAAGTVALGGIALVGTGRAALAAGRCAAGRLRARADLCAAEYAAHQRDYAVAQAALSRAQTLDRNARRRAAVDAIRADRAASLQTRLCAQNTPPEAAAHTSACIEQNLTENHRRYLEYVQQVELRAGLAAALAADGDRLSPGLRSLLQQAPSADLRWLQAISERVRQERASLCQDDQASLRLHLREHDEQVAALLAVAADRTVLDEGFAWRRRLATELGSSDRLLLERRLEEGERRLHGWQMRNDRALAELRATELGPLWGRLQAVGGLFADLQTLASAGVLVPEAAGTTLLDEAVARYQALEHGPLGDLVGLRAEAARIAELLDGLERRALATLADCYHGRVATEVEQQLRLLELDGAPFSAPERRTEADGSVAFRVWQGAQSFDVQVRADGTLKYDAHRFGDERCLKLVYALLDGLAVRGVIFEQHDPELTKQAQMVVLVREALKQINGYGDDQIRIFNDAGTVRIEANKGGLGFQTVEVDQSGALSVPQAAPASAETIAAEAEKPHTKQRAKDRERQARPRVMIKGGS